jgi:modulator of FtsH protease HflC
MNQKTLITGAVVGVAVIVVALGSLFTVDERETAFVLQFGELQKVYETPGLKMKIPFMQEVVKYDKRLLNASLPAMEVTAGDQKRIVIDVFARYVITDPVLFFKTVQNDKGANIRLSTIIARSMRRVVGQIPLTKLLSKDRVTIMDQIHKEVRASAKDFGIDVMDVRIVRADLPKENSKVIFNRMESEREREAKLHIAEGDKAAKEITSKADKDRTIILAEANKKARLIEGDGEATATKIYAKAASQDPAFYEFYRSLQAYEESLDKDTTYVLSKDNKFFKHF